MDIIADLENRKEEILFLLKHDDALANMIFDMINKQRILKLGHPLLYTNINPVQFPLDKETKQCIHKMKIILSSVPASVGLSANQIGVNKQIIVYRKEHSNLCVLINPVIEEISDEKEYAWEGCLSIPGIRIVIPRYKSIHLSAFNEENILVEEDHTGYIARHLQRFSDYLIGKTILDYMQDYKELFHKTEIDKYPITFRTDAVGDIP